MLPSCTIRVGHVLDELAEMPAGSVHAICTSPPYWGQRDYKGEPQEWPGSRVSPGAWHGHLGLEPTLVAYVDHLLGVFRALRRVLRDDGTAWVVMGDTYCSPNRGQRGGVSALQSSNDGSLTMGDSAPNRLPQKEMQDGDLCLVPHRLAIALQADGWIVRQAVIWAKGISLAPSVAIHHANGVDDEQYSGSTMPESLAGVRWERCRVKVANSPTRGATNEKHVHANSAHVQRPNSEGGGFGPSDTEWSPCPGCPKCEAHDGLVLKRGSWRPTASYEVILQLAKARGYYCDGEAVAEVSVGTGGGSCFGKVTQDGPGSRRHDAAERERYDATRNLRAVWAVSPVGFPGAHFATYPPRLIEPIVRASTSERGVCPGCGAPWARVVEKSGQDEQRHSYAGQEHRKDGNDRHGGFYPESTTVGWRPTCGCEPWVNACSGSDDHDGNCGGTCEMVRPGWPEVLEPVPATVLDPFAGAGTTMLVARQLGRASIGIELNPEYAAMAAARVAEYAPLFAGG